MAQAITFQRIFCLTEPSAPGEALHYAFALSRSYGAKLVICHCAKGPSLDRGYDSSTICECKKRVEEAVARSAPWGLTLDWACRVTQGEDVGEATTREAAEQDADLIIVLSKRGQYGVGLLGSTVESVCRTAACPVFVTHAGQRQWVTPSGEVSLARVLVAYDFSDESELALRYGFSLAREYQAELHLLHVLPDLELLELDVACGVLSRRAASHRSVRNLQATVPEEARLRCDVKDAVRWGAPFREVLSYAEDYAIDLICMGSRGAGYGMQSLFGSNTDRVLRQASCPVLIARPLSSKHHAQL